MGTMAGMLHDLYSYKIMNSENHAENGAVLARQILEKFSLTTNDETDLVCPAIRNKIYSKSYRQIISKKEI